MKKMKKNSRENLHNLNNNNNNRCTIKWILFLFIKRVPLIIAGWRTRRLLLVHMMKVLVGGRGGPTLIFFYSSLFVINNTGLNLSTRRRSGGKFLWSEDLAFNLSGGSSNSCSSSSRRRRGHTLVAPYIYKGLSKNYNFVSCISVCGAFSALIFSVVVVIYFLLNFSNF